MPEVTGRTHCTKDIKVILCPYKDSTISLVKTLKVIGSKKKKPSNN